MKSDSTVEQDNKSKILKERAAKLALESIEDNESDEIEVCEFMLDRERYGIESKYIREVCPLKSFTRVPCTPSYVVGVINIRGQILSVIDIRKFFNLPGKGLTDLNKVIILHSTDMEFGILADEILGVTEIKLKNIETSLTVSAEVSDDFLKGVTGERLIILDGLKILTNEKLVVKEEVDN